MTPEEVAGIPQMCALIEAIVAERDGLAALVDRMHAQDVIAIKQWQAANPGNDLRWPDQMRLTAWCMGEAAKATAERDALQRDADKHDTPAWVANEELNHALHAMRADRDRLVAVNARLREALLYVVTAHGEQLHDAYDNAQRVLAPEPKP